MPELVARFAQPVDPSQISGWVDLQRKRLDLQKAQETYGADVARTKAGSANTQLAYHANAMNTLAETLPPLIADNKKTPDQVDAWITQKQKQLGLPDEVVQPFRQQMLEARGETDPQKQQDIMNKHLSGAYNFALSEQSKLAALSSPQASSQQQDIGGSIRYNPTGATVLGAQMKGQTRNVPDTQKTLSPSLVDWTDPNTGQQYKIPSSLAMHLAERGSLPTGLNPNEEKQLSDAANDWSDTKRQLPEYQKVHSDQQNVQSLVKQGATTGNFANAKNALYGSLSSVIPGLESATDMKTRNDLIQKFMAQSNLGGNTDAGRALLGLANPHLEMSGDAILEASRYVDAVKKVQSQEKAEVLGKYTGDHKAYNDRLVKYNSAMTPTVMMVKDMTPEDRKAWLAKQPPEVRKDISERFKKLSELEK